MFRNFGKVLEIFMRVLLLSQRELIRSL
jgi:hypothetical protein